VKFVMPRNMAIGSDRKGGSRKAASARLRGATRSGAFIAAAIALTSCFAVEPVMASEPAVPSSSTIQRSMRVISRKYVISPSAATVAANQTQHFGVVDAQGKPVAVRWNISGLGCYGASCGSIDAGGVYHPPVSLPKPRLVTLEGVVISDPHFSVLTQIKLEEATPEQAQQAAGAQTTVGQNAGPQSSGQEIASQIESTTRPGSVEAAPEVDVSGARAAATMPLPSGVASAPTVAKQDIAGRAGTMAVPSAVGTAPTVSTVTIARASDQLPLPAVVASAPVVAKQDIAGRTETMPVPAAVAATPVVGKTRNERGAELPMQVVVGAAPTVGKQDISSRVESMPLDRPVSAAPKTLTPGTPRSVELIPTPTVVMAAPTVAKQETGNRAESMPLPKAVSAPAATEKQSANKAALAPLPAPMTAQNASSPARIPGSIAASPVPNAKTQTTLVAKNQIPTGTAASQSLPTTSTTPAETMPYDSARVTYRDGQLTIDARNATLADVLKLVAQKTGATIDVPAGTGLERIVEHAGPGTPNDVLTQLLNGSQFNFILVNSPQRPQDLAEVVLSVRPAGGEVEVVSQTPAPPAPEPASLTSSNPFLYHAPGSAVPDASAPAQSVQPPPGSTSVDASGQPMKSKLPAKRDSSDQQGPPPQ